VKIFIDVGSNIGQTVDALAISSHGFGGFVSPYEFDRIYTFEPVPQLHRQLVAKFRDPGIIHDDRGMWKETCEKRIYSPGSEGGSVFSDKRNVNSDDSTLCRFVRASDWFREHVHERDEVYVKLNVEGSEVDIIEDLLDSGEFRKIKSLAVTFDVRKIPSQSHREAVIRQRLAVEGHGNVVDLASFGPLPFRSAIQEWLAAAGAFRPSLATRIKSFRFRAAIFLKRIPRYLERRLNRA
jgi:FkbM family methyltransferase